MTAVYLASPIDQAGSHDVEGMRRDARLELARRGAVVYDPSRAFAVGGAYPGPEIYRINEAALAQCDSMLALMPPGVPSTGTPMEVASALGAGMRVSVIGGSGWQMQGLQHRYSRLLRRYELPGDISAAAGWVAEAQREHHVKYAGDGAKPKRAYPGDAGWDLTASETVELAPGEFKDVPCGISMQLPPGVWGLLVGRSSSIRKRGLLVYQGIIDHGYRGPLFAGALNVTDEWVTVQPGERVAQLIPMPLVADGRAMLHVGQLDPSDRGEAGFGSTGT